LRVESVRQPSAVNKRKASEDGSIPRTSHLRRGYETALAV
jgi:hypothetical protein